jgi:outer membrane protein assembly factor BamD
MKLLEGKGKKSLFQSGMGTEALVVEVFRTVIKNSPYGQYAASAQYNIALYLQEQGLLQEARDEFEKTLNDYPGSEWAQNAQYQIALADAKRSSDAPYEQKVTEVAIQELEGVLKDSPDAAFSQEAEQQIKDLKDKEARQNFLIAEYYEKRKEYRAAKIYYSKIVENYKDTPWAAKALNKIRDINDFDQP